MPIFVASNYLLLLTELLTKNYGLQKTPCWCLTDS